MKTGTVGRNERLEWADVVKGACMLLVVCVHVTNKHFLGLEGPAPVAAFWDILGRGLNPIRMPLFFFVSGLLAARSLSRALEGTWRSRILRPYYLYAVWLAMSCGMYALIGSAIDGSSASSLKGVISLLLYPSSSLWYLYALAAYFLLAKILGLLPARFAFAIALLLAIAASLWPVSVESSVVGNFLFFWLGAIFPGHAKGIASAATPARVVVACVFYGGIVGLYVVGADSVPGIRPVASVVAIWVGITIFAMITKWRNAARPLTYIGRQTLPIYVLHLPLLAVVDHYRWWDFSGQGWTTQVLAAVYPMLLVGSLVATSIGLRELLLRLGLNFLFDMPSFPIKKIKIYSRSSSTRNY